MPNVWILTFVLVIPADDDAATPRTPDSLRADYSAALQNSAPKVRPDYSQVVPALTALYDSLSDAEGLSQAETRRMRLALTARLEQIRDRLIREKIRTERAAKIEARRKGADGRVTMPPDASRAGGAAAGAQQLIDLITATIEPDSWEVNGGRGRIMFYPPLNVLVIRTTGEVHHQIGGTLSTLRK